MGPWLLTFILFFINGITSGENLELKCNKFRIEFNLDGGGKSHYAPESISVQTKPHHMIIQLFWCCYINVFDRGK